MTLSLEGATALVTGATRGIGRAVAEVLAERGVRLALTARSREPLQELAQSLDGAAFPADLMSEAGAAELAHQVSAHFGDAPAILVNAAGAFDLAAVAETDLAAFDAMIMTNLRAPFVLARALLPAMIERRSGHIVSIGSVAGRTAFPGNGAYSASKYGLRGLHEVLEQELKGTGVRSSLIEPAATDTALWDPIDRAAHPGLPTREQMLSADAVAECVLFALERPDGVTVKYLGIERS